MVTDPIADMHSRIRNSLVARHDHTDMPASKTRVALAQVLKSEGYIGDFEVCSEGSHKTVRIRHAYTAGREPVIMGIQRVSRPGLRVYAAKREISRDLDPEMRIEQKDGQIVVSRPSEQPRHRALHGLTRSLVANMVTGVTAGFSKQLELQGVGYRAQMQGRELVLAIGFSHPVNVPPPPGIEFEVEGTSRITVKGINREQVGQVAADVRKVRPPEPYKGKGIRYTGEYVRRKAGKAGKATH